MRLGKAVLTEAFDLLEERFAEFAPDALFRKTVEQPIAMAKELAAAFPRRHVAPELIGFAPRVPRPDDRDLHHLLLKQRDAESPFEDRPEFGVRRGDGFFAVSAAKIRMHHAALNRPRSHDRDLHHEVVKAARPEPRKHRHLRAAFDLKDPHGVGATHHVVNPGILGRNARHHVERIERLVRARVGARRPRG